MDSVTAEPESTQTQRLFKRGIKRETLAGPGEKKHVALEEESDEEEENSMCVEDLFRAIRAPRFFQRSDISEALWIWNQNVAEVTQMRGKVWTTTGIIRNSKFYCFVEEAIYLVERGSLFLNLGEGSKPATVQQAYSLLDVPGVGCSFEAYMVYSHLRRLGYIVGRHGVKWSYGSQESKKSKQRKKRLDERKTSQNFAANETSVTDIGEAFSSMSVKSNEDSREKNEECGGIKIPSDIAIENSKSHSIFSEEEIDGCGKILRPSKQADRSGEECPDFQDFNSRSKGSSPTDHPSKVSDVPQETNITPKEKQTNVGLFGPSAFGEGTQSCGKASGDLFLMFDVYRPNARKFKKTNPDPPLFSLCVSSTRPPRRAEVLALESENSEIPVKFASVSSGIVTIFGFDTIQLPTLI